MIQSVNLIEYETEKNKMAIEILFERRMEIVDWVLNVCFIVNYEFSLIVIFVSFTEIYLY